MVARRKAKVDIGEPPPGIRGLSEQEAVARRPEFYPNAEMQDERRRFFRRAVNQGLISTFNIDLFGIAIVLLSLGSPNAFTAVYGTFPPRAVWAGASLRLAISF